MDQKHWLIWVFGVSSEDVANVVADQITGRVREITSARSMTLRWDPKSVLKVFGSGNVPAGYDYVIGLDCDPKLSRKEYVGVGEMLVAELTCSVNVVDSTSETSVEKPSIVRESGHHSQSETLALEEAARHVSSRAADHIETLLWRAAQPD